MVALIRIAVPVLTMLAVPVTVSADTVPAASEAVSPAPPLVERWRPFIAEASRRFGVPQAWIAAVMQAESRGNTEFRGRPITSPAGAMGLMQVMPATWAQMRAQYGLGLDPFDPHDNIMAGTAYLRAMHDRFGYPGLFAAYNAGPGRYAEHLRTGRMLPGETRAYIAQLARAPATPSMPPAILSGTRLFFALGAGQKPAATAAPSSSETPQGSTLFVPLGSSREERK